MLEVDAVNDGFDGHNRRRTCAISCHRRRACIDLLIAEKVEVAGVRTIIEHAAGAGKRLRQRGLARFQRELADTLEGAKCREGLRRALDEELIARQEAHILLVVLQDAIQRCSCPLRTARHRHGRVGRRGGCAAGKSEHVKHAFAAGCQREAASRADLAVDGYGAGGLVDDRHDGLRVDGRTFEGSDDLRLQTFRGRIDDALLADIGHGDETTGIDGEAPKI